MGRARIRLDLVPVGEGSPDRRQWLLRAEGSEVGRLRADHSAGEVTIEVVVDPEARRRGVARGAIGRLLGMAPWGPDVRYLARLDPADVASAALAQTVGFQPVDEESEGRRVWARPAPRPRAAADDIARFLDSAGRIDRYPLRAGDRRELLEWVAARAFPAGHVLDEKGVNELLAPYAPGGDVAVLRRYLVDHGLLTRTASGSEYVRER